MTTGTDQPMTLFLGQETLLNTLIYNDIAQTLVSIVSIVIMTKKRVYKTLVIDHARAT